MKNSWTELNQYELNQFSRAFKSQEQSPCHFTCEIWVYSNQDLFSVHLLFSSSLQNAIDVYLFYSEEALFESLKIKRPQRNLLNFISTISIIQWHEIVDKHSYYLEPGLKPWNFISLILPGPRLIIWILPAALTYLIKYFLSFIHHPVSWDLFQKY